MTVQDRIVIDPQILVGKPVVRGTRLAVEFIIELICLPKDGAKQIFYATTPA